MYCPKCSQPQSPDEVKFCSRCGFQLAAVLQLLKTDGIANDTLPLIRLPEVRKGAKRILISLCLFAISFPIMGIIDPHFPLASPFIIGIAFFIFIFAVIQMIYYVFFGKNILPTNTGNQLFTTGNQPQLNYQPLQSLPFETRLFDTAEFIQPPSITEPTAELIKRK